jgi:HlyD family secretion protein
MRRAFSITCETALCGQWFADFLGQMDIARPEFKQQKRRRHVVWVAVGLVFLMAITVAISRLKPATPEVERSTIWTDTVKRGAMVRQVRGMGSLIPSQEFTRQIPAETDATVVRILKLPGSEVKADTILLKMSNPQVEQTAVDAKLQLKAAEAQYQSLRVKLQGDLMSQKAGAATINSDYSQARLQADTDKALFELGVISGIAYKNSKSKADEFTTRNNIEDVRLEINQKSIESQLAEQQTKVEQVRALAKLKQKEMDALEVRAGIDGVLVDLPLQVGQHLIPGTMLAKVVQPNHLLAELKIAETQAHDVQIGQAALIDTRNGTVSGEVVRIDPVVQSGTVTVDVRLMGELPKGVRPDLTVDGTIDLERLDNVLYVGRPAVGQENNTISLFRLDPNRKVGVRISVKVGRVSMNSIQVVEGLKEGDIVILSDMSRYENIDRIRID